MSKDTVYPPPQPSPGGEPHRVPHLHAPADASLDLGTLPSPGANGSSAAGSRRHFGADDHEGVRPAAATEAPGITDRSASREPGDRDLRGWFTLDSVSLQVKLFSLLLIAMVSALTVTGFGVQAVLHRYLMTQLDGQLFRLVEAGSHNDAMLNQVLRGAPMAGDYWSQLCWDGGGCTPSAPFGEDAEPTDLTFPRLTSNQAAALVGQVYTVRAGGVEWHAMSVPVFTRDQQHLPGSVTILRSLNGVDHAVDQVRMLTLIFGACVMGGGLLLGGLAIRRSFAPLTEMEETAAAIAAGDLSRRVPERPPSTEVGRLTASLNGMLAQIERAFRAREASEARTRRFAADASHELRTPLAAIRGYAELYRQGAVPSEEVPRTLRRIEDEATRMGRMVEDLLLLARLDEQRPGRNEPVDLAVLANDAAHDARGLDASRQVRLVGIEGARGPTPATVIGDEDRLRQVVANLVANSIRHTPTGTPIEIAVGVGPGTGGNPGPQAIFEVRDHGPGLPPEQAERVFERFYRVDSSRSRGRGGGSGLGLSIVAAVVNAHHGEVRTFPTPGGGATFRVELPAAPGPVDPDRTQPVRNR